MSKQYISGLVSVIIPVYNAEKHIKQTIVSVEEQTYKAIEIVIVDDCSTDSSREIIDELKKRYNNINYYLQEKNQGAGVARNKALEMANGQYVAFLDSDDVWKMTKLEKQLSVMKERHKAFGYTAIEIIDEDNRILKTKRKIAESCTYSTLLHNTMIATSSVLIDRFVFGDFRMSERRGGQDYATWLKLLSCGEMACGVDEALVQYRRTSGSLSSNKLDSFRQVWEIQTQDMGINYILAAINLILFGFNAFRKHIL